MGVLFSRPARPDGSKDAESASAAERKAAFEAVASQSGAKRLGDYLPWILGSFVAWAGARPIAHRIIKHLIPDADPRADLYALSVVNGVILGGYGLSSTLVRPSSPNAVLQALSILTGYLMHDMYATRADWMQYPADSIHHVLGIGLAASDIYKGALLHYIPGLFSVELSSIPLSMMWLLRQAGKESSRAYTATMAAFVVSFFATRLLYMPRVIWKMRKDPVGWARLGRLRYVLYAIQALQVYWGAKIAALARRALLSPAQ